MPLLAGPTSQLSIADLKGDDLMKRTLAALLGLVWCTLSINPASAEYPDKVVRIIVPVAAGGGVDVMARLLAQRLSERWGQQFIVENRAGRRLYPSVYAEQPFADGRGQQDGAL
jgi:hypothetical protein